MKFIRITLIVIIGLVIGSAVSLTMKSVVDRQTQKIMEQTEICCSLLAADH